MKKTFISLFLLSLLTVFGSLSVKADTVATLSFVYDSAGNDKDCNGNDIEAGKGAVGGDFQWSGKITDAIEKSGDWIGVNGSTRACSRSTVHLNAAGDYTFTMDVKWTEGGTRNLPRITITGQSEKTPDIGSSYTFTNNETKTLVYTFNGLAAGDYDISVYFEHGERTKQFVKNLVIASSAPATPTYDVTVNNDGNGTASADKAKYEAGETVTLTAEPNANYLFDGWTTSDNGFSFADEHSASTTFTMPAKAVTVQANFVACSGQTVTVNVNDEDMGSATGGGSYCAGSQVNLTATPNSGYRFVNWTVTSGSASLDNVNNASTHFTMSNPAAAVTVQANFEVNPCTDSKTIQCETDRIIPTTGTSAPSKLEIITSSHHYSGYHGDGYCDFKDSEGELYYLFRAPSSTYNFTVYLTNVDHAYMNIYTTNSAEKCDETTITYGGTTYYKKSYHALDGPTGDNPIGYRTVSSVSLNGTYIIGLYGKSWTVYDQVVIEASTDVFCPNTITMEKSGDESADNPTSSANAAMAGTEVTITAGEASANHYFSGWTVSPENAVTFADQTNATTTFVMPAEDVTITANYGEVVSSKFTYTTSGSGSITCATESGSSVISDTPISMTAVPSTDYVFTGWTATAGTFSDAATLTTTFTMPAEAATVTATFAQVDNKIITGTSETVIESNGAATLTVASVSDFDAFNHNVLKFAYSDMGGKYKGQKVAIDEGYSSASSAGATGFGFYYKTEKADDNVAFCFEVSNGQQVKWELQATNNVWKYYYFAHPEAAGWAHSGIFIYMNGDDDGAGTHTTYKNDGAFYMSEIAATSITSKPDINTYTYTRENASNSYGTLCLPMDGLVSGATLYSVAGKQEEGGKLYIVLEEQGATLEAGEPYIFETNGSTLTATMSGPHSAVKADANGLVGTYQQITAPVYNGSDDLNYVLALDGSNNTVFKKVGEDVTVGAYRAYLNIHNAGDYSPASAAPGRKYIRFGIEGTEEEQAVEMIYDDASLRTRKIMQNGHLYILRDGHLFTAQGIQIK